MRTRPLGTTTSAVLAAAALIAGGVAAAAAPAQADTATFGITQNVLPGLAHATDLGAAAASTPMHLVLSQRPDVAG